jgi:hypothetical protein
MTSHIYHPRIWSSGYEDAPVLLDECPRCQEHASHPHQSLDNKHIAKLKKLWETNGPYYSHCDKKAAERLFGVVR